MTVDILTTALELAAAGYSVLPVKADHSKAPAVTAWRPYTTTAADDATIRGWFTRPAYGLGIITGPVSGNLEMTELEGRAMDALPELRQLAIDSGIGDLWDKVTRGWVETTPGGGIHFQYRITDGTVPGNTKLARRPATPDELAVDPLAKVKTLAETRGANGFVVIAPTPGSCHETGRPWVRLLGGPDTIPTITMEERDAFHAVLRTLDQALARPENIPAAIPATPRDAADGITPGDDFEAKKTWAEILTPHGWTPLFRRGSTTYWRRPGKNVGMSATTGHADDRDRLFVFTSSSEFEVETPYTKFGAYALLKHGGDHSAAAKALADEGFGTMATRLRAAPDVFFDDILGSGRTPTAAPVSGTATPSTVTASPPTVTASPPTVTTSPPAGTPPVATVTSAPERPIAPDEDNTALVLVDVHQNEIRYCPERGSWLTWDGYRWAADDREHVRELVRQIARRLPDGLGWAAYRKRALSAAGVTGILRLAQSDPRIVAPIDLLDARPYELNTPAGIVDLRTGNLRPPDPAALHTRSTTVAPDPAASRTRWDAFLADTFAGDPEMIGYVQRALGLSLVGAVLEQVFFFAHGAGANGKSTLMGAVQHIVGIGTSGYAASAPADMLLATKNHGHPTEIARLSGQRLVVTSELNEGQKFDEARIKELTGKDILSGRFMRQDLFDFTPTHTLWLLANNEPQVSVGGPAMWRRVKKLPFVHTVPENRRVPDLEDRLVGDEAPAILAWLIQGAADYFADGLGEPESVKVATKAYEAGQNTVGSFVADCCDVGDPNAQHMHVRSSVLRTAYEKWCTEEGVTPVPPRSFTLALKGQFGVQSERSSAVRSLAGIRLKDVDDDDGSVTEASRDDEEASLRFEQTGW